MADDTTFTVDEPTPETQANPEVVTPEVPATSPLDKPTEARLNGYDWPEIEGHVATLRGTAEQYGYSPEEVNAHLGYADPDKLSHELQTSVRLNTAAADEDTHPMEAASGGVLTPGSEKIPVNTDELTPDQRAHYADALTDGTTKSPQDYAQAFTDAVSGISGHDASPATNAVAAQLPSPQEVTDYAIGIAQTAGLTGADDVKQVRQNILDVWAQTGMTPKDVYNAVHAEPSFMAALLNPQPPTPASLFPTMEQLQTPGFEKPLVHVLDPVEIAKGLLYAPGMEADNMAKVRDLIAKSKEPNDSPLLAPKPTAEDIFAQIMEGPTARLLGALIGGKVVGKGIDHVPETVAAMRDVLGDIRGGNYERIADRTRLANEVTVEGMARSVIGAKTMPEALDDIIKETESPLTKAIEATPTVRTGADVVTDKAEMAAIIRQVVGESTYSKAMARQTLEGYFTAVNTQVPSYLDWIKDFQDKMRDTAVQKAAWIKSGGDPEAFSAEDPTGEKPTYHRLQQLLDHIEDRPGGARLEPDDPLMPMANAIKAMMTERRDMLANYVTDTSGWQQDYFPHSWVDSKARVEQAFPDMIGKTGSTEHIQARSIPYIMDGIVRGLTPKFPNPIEGSLHYIQGIDDMIASERARSWLTDNKIAYYASTPKNPGDKLLKGRASTKTQMWIDDKTKKPKMKTLSLYAPKGYASVYNNWVGKGFEGWAGSLIRKITMGKNCALGLSLGLSGFHPMAMVMQIVASQFGGGIGNVTRLEIKRALTNVGLGALVPVAVAQKYIKGQRLQNIYMDQEDKLGSTTELLLKKIYIQSGGAAPTEGRGEPYFSTEAKSLFKTWEQAGSWNLRATGRRVAQGVGMAAGAAIGGVAGGGLGAVAGAAIGRLAPVVPTLIKSTWNDTVASIKGKPGDNALAHELMPLVAVPLAIAGNFAKVSDAIMSPLFDDFIPKIKMAVWADIMEDYLRRYPAADRAAILRQGREVMDSVDDRFGEMNMRNVFWNPYVKQLLNASLVSMGWEYGTFRAAERSLEDLILKKEGQRFTVRANAVLGLVLAGGFAAGTYTYLSTGKLPSLGHTALGIAETTHGPM